MATKSKNLEEESLCLTDEENFNNTKTSISYIKVLYPQSVKFQIMKQSLFNKLCAIGLFVSACLLVLWMINFMSAPTPLRRPDIKVQVISISDDAAECDQDSDGFIERFLSLLRTKDSKTKSSEIGEVLPTCSNIADIDKFDCFPEPNSNEDGCLKRGCCWKALKNNTQSSPNSSHLGLVPLGTPYCYYPSNYEGYQFLSSKESPTGIVLYFNRVTPSGFPDDLEDITVNCTFVNNDQLQIKISDSKRKRFEVPPMNIEGSRNNKYQSRNDARQYKVNYDKQKIWVTRISTGKTIFSLNINELVFANQFIQASIKVPSNNIYGIGESKAPFLRNSTWSKYVLFARDRAPTENYNLYGVHPFYLIMEDDESENTGNSHGVVLLNSNAMEVVLQPTPAITFRPIGGLLNFLISVGPSPKEVIQQYTWLIGTSFMPPYWSLGFHLCRFGYNNVNNTREVWKRNRDAGIPIDVQWNDIDYMNLRNDFTLNPTNFAGLPDFVDELHKGGMHYMMIFDPAISNVEPIGTYPPYDEGVQMDIFVKNTTGQLLIGKVWNRATAVFPDFTNPRVISYWSKQFKRFHNLVPFDGAWIDMNEPSNFVDGSVDGCPHNSPLENPPYVPGNIEPLRSKTLCMSAQQYLSTHYDIHNLYGTMETVATNIALMQIRRKRPFIISRSTFPSQGHYGGHWDGDIFSTWDSMRWSISSIMNLNMFGISVSGADICGFNGNTTAELCARWSSLGAFYPFARNHNSDDTVAQDPVALGPKVVKAARNALEQRYFLLPYLYTLFYKSHINGETVARSLMFEFPKDRNTYTIDRQFLWGSGLMIVPVLEAGKTDVEAYLPTGIWYNLQNGTGFSSPAGQTVTFEAAIDEINLLIRGGSILPGQKHEMTTTEARKNTFTLLVALDEDKKAVGDLYWDDGDSLETYERGDFNVISFEAANATLISTCENRGYDTTMVLGTVVIYGVDNAPSKVTVNDQVAEYFYNEKNKVLHCVKLQVSLFKTITLKWQ